MAHRTMGNMCLRVLKARIWSMSFERVKLLKSPQGALLLVLGLEEVVELLGAEDLVGI